MQSLLRSVTKKEISVCINSIHVSVWTKEVKEVKLSGREKKKELSTDVINELLHDFSSAALLTTGLVYIPKGSV